MSNRPILGRAAGVWAGLMTLAAGAVTYGLFPHNAGWIPAWCGLTALHGLAAWGLWSSRAWSRPFAQGLGLFGIGAFGQAAVVLGLWPSILVGVGCYLGLLLLSLAVPDGLEGRQGWSLRLASMALLPAAGFALAPEQTGGVMAATIGGATLVWLGAWGVARGRTWGLLVGLLGAPIMAVSVGFAPDTAYFDAPHFMVGRPLQPLMLDALGAIGAACAMLAVVPFIAPMLRFLRTAE